MQAKTRNDLIGDITGPGSILKPTETEASIKNYWGKITDYLLQGKAYRDEYVSIGFSITGYFKHEEDEFDPGRHQLKINCMLKAAVKGVASEVPLRKVDGNRIIPVINSIYDWGSETIDAQLTPGDALEITGTDLKIHDNLEEEEGVFFVRQSDDFEFRATQIRVNEPKTLTTSYSRKTDSGNLPPAGAQYPIRRT